MKNLKRVSGAVFILIATLTLLVLTVILLAVIPFSLWLTWENLFHADFSFAVLTLAVLIVAVALYVQRGRYILFFFSAVLLVPGLSEKYLVWKERKGLYTIDISKTAAIPDSAGVFGRKPNSKIQLQAYYNGMRLYDVTHRFDIYGLREVPRKLFRFDSCVSIVFAGDDVAYGSGLENDETIPYYVQQIRPDFNVYNFTLANTTPSQTVRLLKGKFMDNVLLNQPTLFVYMANLENAKENFLDHLMGSDSAKARLQPLERASSDPQVKYYESQLYQFFHYNEKIEDYAKDIEAMKRLVTAQYPGTRFQAVLWHEDNKLRNDVASKIAARGISVVSIEEIIPNYYDNLAKYAIYYPYDNAPNKLVSKKVGRYVVDGLLEGSRNKEVSGASSGGY